MLLLMVAMHIFIYFNDKFACSLRCILIIFIPSPNFSQLLLEVEPSLQCGLPPTGDFIMKENWLSLAAIQCQQLPAGGGLSGSPCHTPCWGFLLLEPAQAWCELPPPCEFRCPLPFQCAENPFGLMLSTISGSATLCHLLGRSLVLGGRDVRRTSY